MSSRPAACGENGPDRRAAHHVASAAPTTNGPPTATTAAPTTTVSTTAPRRRRPPTPWARGRRPDPSASSRTRRDGSGGCRSVHGGRGGQHGADDERDRRTPSRRMPAVCRIHGHPVAFSSSPSPHRGAPTGSTTTARTSGSAVTSSASIPTGTTVRTCADNRACAPACPPLLVVDGAETKRSSYSIERSRRRATERAPRRRSPSRPSRGGRCRDTSDPTFDHGVGDGSPAFDREADRPVAARTSASPGTDSTSAWLSEVPDRTRRATSSHQSPRRPGGSPDGIGAGRSLRPPQATKLGRGRTDGSRQGGRIHDARGRTWSDGRAGDDDGRADQRDGDRFEGQRSRRLVTAATTSSRPLGASWRASARPAVRRTRRVDDLADLGDRSSPGARDQLDVDDDVDRPLQLLTDRGERPGGCRLEHERLETLPACRRGCWSGRSTSIRRVRCSSPGPGRAPRRREPRRRRCGRAGGGAPPERDRRASPVAGHRRARAAPRAGPRRRGRGQFSRCPR